MARKKLQGQVAIITGASRGIGAATAEVLSQAGAALVLAARGAEELEAVAQQLRGRGGRVIAVPADVTDPEQVEEVVEAAVEQFGRVDILVNNAGVIWPLERITDVDMDEWAYNIHVNLVGPFYLTRNVLPLMLQQNYGRIVNLSSKAAITPLAGGSAYCAAKAGLDMFTRVLCAELQGTRVAVHSLYPGHVDTEMQADIRSVDGAESGMDTTYFHELYDAGKLRTPADVGRAIYWLVSPWNKAENGRFFDMDDAEWSAQVEADLV